MATKDPKLSRGFRNRNPGNIDYNERNKWIGQTGREDGGGRFAAFDSHENGIRTICALLQTYQDRYGLNTVEKIINRWAPPHENVTSAYVMRVTSAVKEFSGDDTFTKDVIIDAHKFEYAFPIVRGIITVELGGNPYADSVIEEGLRRAGVVRKVETVAQAATTPTGRGAITIASIGALAGVAPPVLSSLGTLNPWLAGGLVVSALGAALYYVLDARRTPTE